MSREIKFDFVWDAGGEIKRQAFTIDEILKAKVKTPRYSKGAINIQAELIAKRQFTGLRDVNGVEIYEGDIVKVNDERVSTVEYKYTGFYVKVKSVYSSRDFDVVELSNWETLEVIGNKIEHPHLLDGSK